METHEKGTQQEATAEAQQPEIRRAPDFITVYATTVRVAYSQYDVRVFLGDVVFPNPSDDSKKEVVQERICVILPPDCAEALGQELEMLGNVSFEEVRGNRQTS